MICRVCSHLPQSTSVCYTQFCTCTLSFAFMELWNSLTAQRWLSENQFPCSSNYILVRCCCSWFCFHCMNIYILYVCIQRKWPLTIPSASVFDINNDSESATDAFSFDNNALPQNHENAQHNGCSWCLENRWFLLLVHTRYLY